MKQTALLVALWAMLCGTLTAQKGGTEQDLSKEARGLFEGGQYLKAYPLYSQLVSLYPQNPEYNLYFGACAIYSDADKTKAIRFLSIAAKRGSTDPMLQYYLGKAYHLNYQFKDALRHYEEFVAKADPKLSGKYNAQREIETCIYGSNLLSNIKDLMVLNKTEADRNNFFRYMDLTGIGGKILTVPDALKSKLDQKSDRPGVIHYPGNSTTIYFSSFGKEGTTGKDIYKAQMLPDGKFTEPVKLKGDVNTKYDEDFAFMHSDGKTLYFSSKGHNSMGGYDIFKSVYDPATDTFGPAINLDFAINTPDDDIFYIADSLNKRAYFASGRASDVDHLHVYNVMVEGVPLQVVYMKGSYASQFDAEQKTVNIKIRAKNSGRLVAESVSQSSTGNYMTFVDKAGDYIYTVKTENSPQEHQVEVTVPVFQKPVAVRQEMRLLNEGGKERLDIQTFFDEPLDEDLAALAADMLRAKAGLDINATPEQIEKDDQPGVSQQLSVEKTMSNAPLAAGFQEGVTIKEVIESMEKDAGILKQFVDAADSRENSAISLALSKQKQADEMLTRAEALRAEAGNFGTAEDIAKLKESYTLNAKAKDLQREARAAWNAAAAIAQYKSVEKARLDSLTASVQRTRDGEAAGNFDQVYTELVAEKTRQIKQRETSDTPYNDMMAKARAKESARRGMEEKLVIQRSKEQELTIALKTAENRLSNAKKKQEIAEAEQTVVNTKAELDAKRREIAVSGNKVDGLAEEIKQAYADAATFKELTEQTTLASNGDDLVALDANQRQALQMRIASMDERIAALAITDPQMLALVADEQIASTAASAVVNAETTQNTSESIPNSSNTSAPTNANVEGIAASPTAASASSETANTADVNDMGARTESSQNDSLQENSSQAQSTNTTSGVGSTSNGNAPMDSNLSASTPSATATTGALPNGLSESQQATRAALERMKSLPGVELQATSNMLMANQVAQADLQIMKIRSKPAGTLTTEDETALQAWMEARAVASQNIVPTTATAAPSAEQLRATYTSVMPDYANETMAINNGGGTELEHTVRRLEYKQKTLDRLKMARIVNAEKAVIETDPAKLNEMARRDQELAGAIAVTTKEMNDPAAYKAAYDSDISAIIASDAEFRDKLNDQIAISQAYVVTLDAMEEAKALEYEATTDPAQKTAIAQFLAGVQAEKLIATNKISSYESDLRLLATTSEPISTTASAKGEMGSVAETSSTPNNTVEELTPAMAEAAATQLVTENAADMKAMFKVPAITTSIFAYENGALEQLASRYGNETNALKNQEKIKEVNDEIFLVEAEIEIEGNPSRQKKLDREAEALYAKRAALESANAPAIAAMSGIAYEEELARAQSAVAINQDKLDDRIVLRDEVNKLMNQAQAAYEEAKNLRSSAAPVEDVIEKNDFYRRAYAKEMHAIQLLRQVQNINDNIEPLLIYDDQQLTTLRYGTDTDIRSMAVASAPDLMAKGVLKASATTLASNVTTESTSESTNANKANVNDVAAVSPINNDRETNTLEMAAATTNSGSGRENITGGESISPTNPTVTNPSTTDSVVRENASAAANSGTTNPANVTNEATTTAQPAPTSETSASPANSVAETVVESTPIITPNAGNDGATSLPMETRMTLVIASEGNNSAPEATSTANPSENTSDAVTKSEAQPVNSVDKSTFPIERSGNSGRLTLPPSGYTLADAIADGSFNPAEAGYYTAPDAEEYYFAAPEYLYKNLFVMTGRGVYSENNPIPVDGVTPKGIYYMVQVGAFRNRIPQNLYDEFAPVHGETVGNGITRYCAGYFLSFDKADNAKIDIRRMGYGDAFVVAFKDGKRIPMYEAMAATEKDYQASVEKEVSTNARTSPSPASTLANTATTVTETNAAASGSANVSVSRPTTGEPGTSTTPETKNTNYLKGVANAAPATMVETTKGLFFTVQVGVYSKPVSLDKLYNLEEINSELTATQKIRYTSGRFTDLSLAVNRRMEARSKGIADAFITAYYNGERISLSKADELIKELGTSILYQGK